MLDSCRYLGTKGFKITYLPVQKNGLIDLKVCFLYTTAASNKLMLRQVCNFTLDINE